MRHSRHLKFFRILLMTILVKSGIIMKVGGNENVTTLKRTVCNENRNLVYFNITNRNTTCSRNNEFL